MSDFNRYFSFAKINEDFKDDPEFLKDYLSITNCSACGDFGYFQTKPDEIEICESCQYDEFNIRNIHSKWTRKLKSLKK